MSTPSRSRSSSMGSESYFDWRESMEKRQRESERQVQREASTNPSVQLEESSDSTQASTKRRRDRRSRLSDVM
ncbi:hypothetical protein AAG906_023532 [Vitis piasezkii]